MLTGIGRDFLSILLSENKIGSRLCAQSAQKIEAFVAAVQFAQARDPSQQERRIVRESLK